MSEAAPGGPAGGRGGPLRRWLPAFIGFFLVFGAWAFAAPYDGPPDEVQHVIRAAGVVSGQVAPAPAVVADYRGYPGMGAYQRVPAGLLSRGVCWGFHRDRSAACATPIHGGPVRAEPTTAGRYQPVYYALVGLPLRLSPDWTGLLLARLISAALSAALLACAFAVLAGWSRFGLTLAGLIAASTPMLAHLAGAVNPNGLEIASGIAFFAAALTLLLGPGGAQAQPGLGGAEPPQRLPVDGHVGPAVWLLGIAGTLLATLRPLGPLWLLFAAAAMLVPQSGQRLRSLWRHRAVRTWCLVVGAAALLSVAWVVALKAEAVVPVPGRFHYSLTQAALMYANYWGRDYLWGMVGVAGWFDVFLPAPFYVGWIVTTGALIVFAVVAGTWTDRWRFLVLFAGGVLVPGVLQVSQANAVGFVTAGRYMLPLLAGAPLLAAFVLEHRLLDAARSRALLRLCCFLLPAHLALLVYAMIRWQQGAARTHLNPLAGSWHPPTTSYPPLALMVAGLAVLGVVFWTAPGRISRS